MLVANIKISPLDTATGLRTDIYVTSASDRRVTGLNGVTWEPAVTAPPAIGMSLWNGDFSSSIEPGRASVPINMNVVKQSWPAAGGYAWAGAPMEIHVGEPGDAWPWAKVFSGVVRGFSSRASIVTVQAEVDPEPFMAKVLTATYAGSGGAEGPADLKNRVKPLVFGHAKNVEPVLIDAVNSVYQFSSYGAIEEVTTLYERASAFSTSTGDHADYAALVAATLEPGTWATCLAAGMVRLGAPAYGLITGDIKGHKIGASTPRLTGAIILGVADMLGIPGAIINEASFDALDADKPYPVNIVLSEQEDFIDLAQRMTLPCNWQAGISLTGELFATQPDLGGAAAFELNAQGRALPQVVEADESDVSPPYSSTIMGANRAWRVHTADEIAFIATLVYRGLYDDATTYREGDWVDLADGSTWLYINPTPTAGNDPPTWPTTSNTWWENRTPPLAVATVGLLTNATHVVSTAADGSGADFSDAGGTFYVIQGGAIVTTGVTYSVVSETGVDVSIGASTGIYTVGSMSADDGTATFRAVYGSVQIDLVYSIAKAKAGSTVKFLRAYPSRFTIAYDGSGNASPAVQTNAFIAERQNLSGTVTWSITDLNGVARTPVTSYLSAATGDGVTQTVAQFASAQNGTGGIIVTATVVDGATTYTERFNVIKVQAGANGAPGSDGAPAIGYVESYNPIGSGSFVNQTWYNTSTKRWWRWTGSTWVVILGDLSAIDVVGTSNIDTGAIGTATHWHVTGTVGITSLDGWYPIIYGVGITVTHDIKFDAHVEAEIYKGGPTSGETMEWQWKIVRSTTSYPFTYTDVTNAFVEKYNYPGAGGPTTNALDYRTASMQGLLATQPTGTQYYHIMARVVTTGWNVAFQSARKNLSILNNKRQV